MLSFGIENVSLVCRFLEAFGRRALVDAKLPLSREAPSSDAARCRLLVTEYRYAVCHRDWRSGSLDLLNTVVCRSLATSYVNVWIHFLDFRFVPVSPRYSSSAFMHPESFNRTFHHGHRMMFKLHEKGNKSPSQVCVVKVRWSGRWRGRFWPANKSALGFHPKNTCRKACYKRQPYSCTASQW